MSQPPPQPAATAPIAANHDADNPSKAAASSGGGISRSLRRMFSSQLFSSTPRSSTSTSAAEANNDNAAGAGAGAGAGAAKSKKKRDLIASWKDKLDDIDIAGMLPAGASMDSFLADIAAKIPGSSSANDDADSDEEEGATSEKSSEFAQIGRTLAASGLAAHHPVVIVPGFTSTGLESWCAGACCAGASKGSSRSKKPHFRHRLWGTLAMIKSIIRDQAAWVDHLSLHPDTGLDPPGGIKMRAAQGFDAADYFIGGYWVWGRMIENLAELGYDSNSMHLAAYDWRLAMEDLERRDQYFTRLRMQCELMKVANSGHKVLVVGHSMGAIVFLYFLQWVHSPHGGNAPNWGKDNLAGFANIAGPLLGAPKCLMALLTGEMRDTVQQPLGASALEKFFGRVDRARMFRTWGSLAAMLPKGGTPVWGGDVVPATGKGEVAIKATSESAPDGALTGSMLLMKREHVANATGDVKAAETSDGDQVMLDVEEAQKLLIENAGTAWAQRFRGMYSFGLNQDGEVDQREWVNPLEAPLPNMGTEARIWNLYGVGAPTERAYAYSPPEDADSLGRIDTTQSNDEMKLKRGILLGDGDGTVPLVSLGLMGASAWRDKHWNPYKIPVFVREYQDQADPKLARGGPRCADHVNILGNSELTEDILKLAAGKPELVQERYLTDVRAIGERVLKRIEVRAGAEHEHEAASKGKRKWFKKLLLNGD